MSEPTNGTKYRLDNLERRVDRLESQPIQVMSTEIHYLKQEVADVKRLAQWCFRTLVGMSVTILVGAIIYAATQGNP